MKTYQDYVDIYKKKTGIDAVANDDFNTFFLPNRGFCQYSVTKNPGVLTIWHCCGDGKFWLDVADIFCQLFVFDTIVMNLSRNPKAYTRSMGFEGTHTGEIETYFFKGEDKNGREATIRFSHFENKKPIFIAIMEV